MVVAPANWWGLSQRGSGREGLMAEAMPTMYLGSAMTMVSEASEGTSI